MPATTFITSPYRRSHMREPRGRGGWAFQVSRTYDAFDRDMVGEPVFFNGTYTEAKRQAKAYFAGVEYVAVMP